MTGDLNRLVTTFQRHLYLPDPSGVLFMLATVVANRLPGDPVWGMLVNPPSSLKTEFLNSLLFERDIYEAATLTEASLLSGTSIKERGEDATGGLLCEVGKFGIILSKDFTSVISMRSDKRRSLLAAFREIYDGRWIRRLGVDGGRTLVWEGKVGFLGACTETIDRQHELMSSMGERFVLFRLPPVDPMQVAERAYDGAADGDEIRLKLRTAISMFLSDLGLPDTAPDADSVRERLQALAVLVASCRSAVERNSYSREIELVPGPEGPGRIVKVFAQLWRGLAAIGLEPTEAWPIVEKVGFDSIPIVRAKIVEMVRESSAPVSVADFREETSLSDPMVRRHLQDLEIHGVLSRTAGSGDSKREFWDFSERTRELLSKIQDEDGDVSNTERAEVSSPPPDSADSTTGDVSDFPPPPHALSEMSYPMKSRRDKSEKENGGSDISEREGTKAGSENSETGDFLWPDLLDSGPTEKSN